MLRNLRIRKKFTILTFIILLGMGLSFFLAMRTLTATAIGGPAYSRIIMSKDLTADILPPPLYVVESYMEMLEMVCLKDQNAIASKMESIRAKRKDYETRRALWTREFPEGPMKTLLLAGVCDSAAAIFDLFEKALAPAVQEGHTAEADALLAGRVSPLFAKHRAAVEELAGLLDAYAKQTEAGGVEDVRSGALWLGVGIACVLAVVLVFFVLLSRDFTRTFARCLGFARDVAQGRLDATLEMGRRDDFGQLGAALCTMLAELKKTIGLAEDKTKLAGSEVEKAQAAIREAEQARLQAEAAREEGMLHAADSLHGVVCVVSQAAVRLSDQVEHSRAGADDQSRLASEAATAMEEMNATVLEVARNAAQAAEKAGQAWTKAQEGSQVVSRVVAGIDAVQGSALDLKTDMAALGEQAQGIGRVLNVITDIADQTNLLALNAAIEAARAGDAGRGFAVVADEVRKLAEKTMTATKEVGQAVAGIQDGAKRTISNVERAVDRINEATDLASQSGEALGRIVELVEQTTDQVRAIAAAAEQQSAASEEINRSVEEVNRISAETADAMRQSSEAVGELGGQARELERLVAELKGEKHGQAAARPRLQ